MGDHDPTSGRRPRRLGREFFRAGRRGLSHLRERGLIKPFLLTFAIAAVLLIALTSATVWWTSQPSFCNRCHVMVPYTNAWEESPHADVNCERCHTQPGTVAFIGGKIASLQVVVNYITGHYDENSFNAVVSNASCLECHEDLLERIVNGNGGNGSNGVRVSHEHIVGEGGKCINCHSTTAHGSAVAPGSRTRPEMANCLQCHDDETAPFRCSICHEPGMDAQTEAAENVKEVA